MNDVRCLDCGEILYAIEVELNGTVYNILICLNCLKSKIERIENN